MNIKDADAQIAQTIGAGLKTAYTGRVGTTSWSQCMETAKRAGIGLGEIRQPSDLQNVPRGVKMRAVFFPSDPNGPVVRWGNGQYKTILGGSLHDYFYRAGDNVTSGKQGYITIDSLGNLTMQ